MTDLPMQSGIRWITVWSNADLIELKIEVSDGLSLFANHVYVQPDVLLDIVADLSVFRMHSHGGLLDVCLGEFGPEYANGAFYGRFHFQESGKIYITCRQQSKFEDLVANEAKIYLKTEPALLDHLIVGLKELYQGNGEVANLAGVA